MKRSCPQVRASNEDVANKAPKILSSNDQVETDLRTSDDDALETVPPSLIDTEAALKCVRNILTSAKDERRKKKIDCSAFPPVVFVHQLYDIIESKTAVNREIEILRNKKKIIVIHLGNEECMKVAVFFDDLKKHALEKCDASEKFLLQRFFDKVLMTVFDVGISRVNLIAKFRFSEKDIRFLVNTGLLILRDTGVLWFSFPSAGTFMKKLIKGRQLLLNCIKKRKYREVLELELKKLPVSKSLELPIMYHMHDLIGGGFVDCLRTSSGRLLRFKTPK